MNNGSAEEFVRIFYYICVLVILIRMLMIFPVKPIGSIMIALSLWTGCASQPRAEYEITLGGTSVADSALRASALSVLSRRIEQIAQGEYTLSPAGDDTYTLSLETELSDVAVQYALTAPGRLEFWEPCYWSGEMDDLLLWSRSLMQEGAEAGRDSEILASFIPYRDPDSEPCRLDGVPSEAYPIVMRTLDSLKAAGLIPAQVRFGRQTRRDDYGNEFYTVYLLKCDAALNGPALDNSFVKKISYAPFSRRSYLPELTIVFDRKGTEYWRKITRENIGRHLVLSLDGEILLVPEIMTPIEDGKVAVSIGTEFYREREALLPCIPVIVGSGTLALPVDCRRK